MRSQTNARLLCFAGLAAVLLAGCGTEGPRLASVSGIVTLDDRPLSGATVEFQPASGSPSTGTTDASGKYKLMYTARKAGATVGKHLVRISHSTDESDAQGRPVAARRVLPARYNRNSELTAEVESGSNRQDFQLKSK